MAGFADNAAGLSQFRGERTEYNIRIPGRLPHFPTQGEDGHAQLL
jgi:hypothetical protein